MGERGLDVGYSLVKSLRNEGISASIDFSQKKLGKRMQEAHEMGAKRVLILGDDECEKGEAKLKKMESGEETALPLNEIASYIVLEAKLPGLSREWNQLSRILESKRLSNALLNESSTQLQGLSKEFDTIREKLKTLSKQSSGKDA